MQIAADSIIIDPTLRENQRMEVPGKKDPKRMGIVIKPKLIRHQSQKEGARKKNL